MTEDEYIEKLGEMKLSELSDEQAEFVLMMLYNRLDEIDLEIEYYQESERAINRQKSHKHFPHQCRRRKYVNADVRHHANEERSDSKDIPSSG